MNLSNSTTSDPICRTTLPDAEFIKAAPPMPPPYLQGVALFVYPLLSVLTIGGNALVCLIVFVYWSKKSVTNLFIANLAFTDLFIGLFCIPIVLVSDYLLCDWPFGAFMCKFTSFIQSVFVTCTIYTLVAMSVDRYVAIIHPLRKKFTIKQCRATIGFLWIFAITFSIPIFLDMNIHHTCFYPDFKNETEYTQTVCDAVELPVYIQSAYNTATLIILYLIPLVLLTIIYLRLGLQLDKTQAPGEAHLERDEKIKKSKRKVIKMCFVVVIMFGVCWLPMQLYTNILRQHIDQVFDQKYIPHIYFAFHLMSMSNSCVNPAIYGVMSSKFRNGYLHYWRKLTTCCRLSVSKKALKNRNPRETQKDIDGSEIEQKKYKTGLQVPRHDTDRESDSSIPCTIPLISSQRVSLNYSN